MSEFNFNENWSYLTNKRTQKILNLKNKIDNFKFKFTFPFCVTLMFCVYIILSYKRYTDYFNKLLFTTSKITSGLKFLDLFIVVLSFILLLYLRALNMKYIELKKSYEGQKKILIEMLDNKICNCNRKCNCQNDYIFFMESHGIDLI